jgi:hypothetical protein
MLCPLGVDKANPDVPVKEGGEEHCWEKEFMEIYNKEIAALDTIEHKRLDAIEAARVLPKVSVLDPKQHIPNKVAPNPS